jgi:hypothetical protein
MPHLALLARLARLAHRAYAPSAAPLTALLVTALLVPLALSVSGAANADAPPVVVHVRGTSRLEPRAARSDGELVLSGVLVDDAARPLAGERVAVSIANLADRGQPLSLATGGAVSACDGANGAATQPTLARVDLVVLPTDDGGRFCVRVGLGLGRYFARFVFAGSARVDGTSAELAGDLALNAVSLRFDPEPRIVELDATSPQTFDAIALVEDERGSTPASGLALSLTNESGVMLGAATTNGGGRVSFSIPPSRLGPPGSGELRVDFAGDGADAPATHDALIERRARVDLSAPEAHDGVLGGGAPEDGVPIDVVASARTGLESRVVPTGMVVARVRDMVVGAAALADGRARVVVTFGAGAATDASVRFDYEPDTPWFERGNDVTVTLPVRGASPWRNAPFLIAGACVLAWLVLGRARVGEKTKTDPSARSPSPASRVEARIEFVRADPGATGWRGKVVDAHDGRAIPDARVSLERSGFERVTVLVTSTTDAAGRFSLAGVDVLDGDKLTSEAPLHGRLEQRAPPKGEIAIALMLRRRKLLERLVEWAKRGGAPFDLPTEPTPGHVRRAAGTSFAIARWADAVERAAFGGAPVDARAEADVERLAPSAAADGDATKRRDANENDTIQDAPRDDDPSPGVEPSDGGEHG